MGVTQYGSVIWCFNAMSNSLLVYNNLWYKMYDSRGTAVCLARCAKMYQGFAKSKEHMTLQVIAPVVIMFSVMIILRSRTLFTCDTFYSHQ